MQHEINVTVLNKKAMTINQKRSLFKRYKLYYLLILPGLLYFVIFHYIPIYGIIISFKDISPFDGINGIFSAPWVGLKHFKAFTNSYYFLNVMGNTIIISLYRIAFGFPAPIILALLLNEVRCSAVKRVVQTISYLPHFISMVVLAGLLTTILTTDGGIVNEVLKFMGIEPIYFLGSPKYFRAILVTSGIWKEIGWSSIIYLAAISGINTELYEAAISDGASKLKQVWHVTLPGISPIIVIMFIFAVGGLLSAGFEQIFLLYSPPVYQVSDIIDTYVYREGLTNMKYSYTAAVGLFRSVIAMGLLLGANFLAKKLDHDGIW